MMPQRFSGYHSLLAGDELGYWHLNLCQLEDIAVESRSEEPGARHADSFSRGGRARQQEKKLIEPRLKADLDVPQLQTVREKLE